MGRTEPSQKPKFTTPLCLLLNDQAPRPSGLSASRGPKLVIMLPAPIQVRRKLCVPLTQLPAESRPPDLQTVSASVSPKAMVLEVPSPIDSILVLELT